MGNVVVTPVVWGFDDQGPSIQVGEGVARYSRLTKVDPAPCYMHDQKRVSETLAVCETAFPFPSPITIFLSPHECLGRTNGWTDYNLEYDYSKSEKSCVAKPYIILMGKRIPIMPAMTRYLVSHEYGHAATAHIAAKRFGSEHEAVQALEKEYALMRGVPVDVPFYGPTMWHRALSEIMANDFRIVMTGMEPEFWPHEISRPDQTPEVIKWWEDSKKSFEVNSGSIV